jgi:hypothetical protein
MVIRNDNLIKYKVAKKRIFIRTHFILYDVACGLKFWH